MIYLRRMRAQSRETSDTRALNAALGILTGKSAQDLNLRPNIRVSAHSGEYLDAVFEYSEATKLPVAYGYLSKIRDDTSPEDKGYEIDFCPSRPKVVQLDDKDFPNPLTIKRLPIYNRTHDVTVMKGEPFDKRLGYKFVISFADYFPQEEWNKVRAALRGRANQKVEDIHPNFSWFVEAAKKAWVEIDTRTQNVCGYDVPFVDVRLESRQGAGESKGLLGEIRDSFVGFQRWYFEKVTLGRFKEYMRNSAIGFLQDQKNPDSWSMRAELEKLRREEMGITDLPPIDQFLRGGEDLKIIGASMEVSKLGRQSHRLAPFIRIREGRFIEEESPERSSTNMEKQIRIPRYYEVLGYDGSFISDEDLEEAFTPEGI